MLQSIRDKISGWVAGVVLTIIAIVFVFFGMQFQTADFSSYAAKVNGDRIPAETVRRAWQNRLSQLQQMMRGELPPELMKQQREQLLDQFVRRKLLSQRAHDLGYRVSDKMLADRIMSIPEFQVDGKFSADRYTAFLSQEGPDGKARFEADFREALQIEQLQIGVIDSAFVTPLEAERQYILQQERRELDYAIVPASAYLDTVEVTDDQVQKWYSEHKDRYQTPERADLEYLEVTRADAEARVEVDEATLRDYYEKVKDRFETPERRRARHILIPTGEGKDAGAAEKLANEIADKAKGGADFAALAKQYSKDPGSADQGGDLGWAQRGMFVGPFEDALFAMRPGEIRGPVKTEFGYHIIKLEAIEAGRVKSFEEARAELESEYRRDQAQQIFYDRSQALADSAFAALTELRSVSEKLNLPIKTVEGFTREGGGALGHEPDVIKAVFEDEEVLRGGQNSQLIAIGEDRAVVVRVAKYKPATPKPLEEVRPQIEEELKRQAAAAAAAKAGAEALKKLQSGASWAQVTAELKVTPAGKREVQRQNSDMLPEVTDVAFSLPAPKSADAPQYAGTNLSDGYALLALSRVIMPDPKAEPAEARNVRIARAAQQLGNRELIAYLAEVERTAKIQKNPQVLE